MKFEPQRLIDITQNLIDIAKARPTVLFCVVALFLIAITLTVHGGLISPRKQKKAWAEQHAIKMYQEIRGLRDYITRITVSETTLSEIKKAIRQSFYLRLFWRKGEIYTPQTLSSDKILRVCDYRHLNSGDSLKWAKGVFRLFFDCLETQKRDVEYLQYFLRHLGELVDRCPQCIAQRARSWDEIELCTDAAD